MMIPNADPKFPVRNDFGDMPGVALAYGTD
ncbi:hypothetical protein LAUMK142_03931 [Mycobacterium pseudokansasii]|uniref:Uncharacterized protein n=1 Tax=Mycobacterium pseudokansasii TaxID=2341080 RepID=A0A498QVE7_9MYCO|nr:hypothetical protein LAUMK142_03931 [Mycobacterium pseudokansasii]